MKRPAEEHPPRAARSNDPTLLILTSLAGGPKHGHALAGDIEAFAGIRLGPGSLYGAITRMEEAGLIEPLPAKDRRRPYRITSGGTELLHELVESTSRVVDEAADRLLLPPVEVGRRSPVRTGGVTRGPARAPARPRPAGGLA